MKKASLFAAAVLAGSVAAAQAPSARQDERGRALIEETKPHHVVTGRIAGVDPDHNVVVVEEANGVRTSLELSAWTVITGNGAPASIGEVREGRPIRATYDVRNGAKRALVLDVSRQGAFPPNIRRH